MKIEELPKETPRAWLDFNLYYLDLIKKIDLKIAPLDFLVLPFEMQFGVFVSYFKSNGLDVDMHVWDNDTLLITICETFKLHENMMSHFS